MTTFSQYRWIVHSTPVSTIPHHCMDFRQFIKFYQLPLGQSQDRHIPCSNPIGPFRIIISTSSFANARRHCTFGLNAYQRGLLSTGPKWKFCICYASLTSFWESSYATGFWQAVFMTASCCFVQNRKTFRGTEIRYGSIASKGYYSYHVCFEEWQQFVGKSYNFHSHGCCGPSETAIEGH
jgi:hypothetical protein